MRILLVGTRYLPFRHAGDKNFWFDVVRGLERLGHEVEIISIMVERVPPGTPPIHRVPPVPVYLTPDLRFNAEFTHLAGTNNYISKTATIPKIGREIRARRREFRPDVVHFADNYGPAMLGLRPAFGKLPTALSAPTYQPNRPLYDVFLRASFAPFDVIVPFSDAYRRRLLELGLPSERVRRIRWGVDPVKFALPSEAERRAAAAKLDLSETDLAVLWTGFTQQTGEEDLRFAVRTAEIALASHPTGLQFLFSFKPEHFKESYVKLERPGLRVLHTAETFDAARKSANLLLSPVVDRRSTAAPPLVWLECLATGQPILTTRFPGAEEAVEDHRSGFLVETPAEGADRLSDMKVDRGLRTRLRDGARQIAVERYSVEDSLREYVELWSDLDPRSKGR